MIPLSDLVDTLAVALKELDEERPTGGDPRFKPGIGPLTETELTGRLIARLAKTHSQVFANASPRGYPGSRATCDLVLPGEWAIEIKLARPYGDNGRPAERWSENLLYPYPGNTSAIGDALKLRTSAFQERKAVVVIGYEHTPPLIPLETAIRSFELIATQVVGLELGPRAAGSVTGLCHPSHQQATVYAWEVLPAIRPGP